MKGRRKRDICAPDERGALPRRRATTTHDKENRKAEFTGGGGGATGRTPGTRIIIARGAISPNSRNTTGPTLLRRERYAHPLDVISIQGRSSGGEDTSGSSADRPMRSLSDGAFRGYCNLKKFAQTRIGPTNIPFVSSRRNIFRSGLDSPPFDGGR